MQAMNWLTIRGTDDVDWSSLNVRCLDTLLRNAPRMITLDISNTMRVRESHVETFPVWLQRLNLARCLSHHDSDEAIVALGRLMNLKAVSLREASCGGAIPFHAWRDLRRIDLRGVDGIHIEEVAEALASAPYADRLEAANLRLATGASGAWFEVLPQLTALRELSFQIGSVDLDALIGVLGSCLLTKVDIWSTVFGFSAGFFFVCFFVRWFVAFFCDGGSLRKAGWEWDSIERKGRGRPCAWVLV